MMKRRGFIARLLGIGGAVVAAPVLGKRGKPLKLTDRWEAVVRKEQRALVVPGLHGIGCRSSRLPQMIAQAREVRRSNERDLQSIREEYGYIESLRSRSWFRVAPDAGAIQAGDCLWMNDAGEVYPLKMRSRGYNIWDRDKP